MAKGDNRTINVRLPQGLADRFDRLAARMPALPKSVILRLILSEFLSRPIGDQVSAATKQILLPETKSAKANKAKLPSNRLPPLNTSHGSSTASR